MKKVKATNKTTMKAMKKVKATNKTTMKAMSSQRGRGTRGEVHRCTACGKEGHRIETCPTKAAAIIRELRKHIKDMEGTKRAKVIRRQKVRYTPNKTGDHKRAAQKAYTGERPPKDKNARFRKGPTFEAEEETVNTPLGAMLWCQSCRFLEKPVSCPLCGGDLSEPNADRRPGFVYVRCLSWQCREWHNAMKFGEFNSLPITMKKLAKAILFYARGSKTRAVRASDLVQHCGIAKTPAQTILNVLRGKEAEAGLRESRSLKLTGNLEGDGHGLRKTFISANNEHFAKEIKAAKALHPNKEIKYFVLHVRLGGLCERGGRICIAPLSFKLVPPGARPPPESTIEIASSKLLDRASQLKQLTIYSDGAHAWPKCIGNYPKLRSVAVAHKKSQFVKVVRRKGGSSSRAGTQSIDQLWRQLDSYIPKELKTKYKHQVNNELYTYVYSWVWRHNLGDANLLAAISKLF